MRFNICSFHRKGISSYNLKRISISFLSGLSILLNRNDKIVIPVLKQ